jgi:glycosyltransferase involved in cell wall biosynthesis
MNILSIIIPIFNESKSIILLLEKIRDVKLNENITKDIIIINDGSTDNSYDVILNYINENNTLNVRVISHETNQGKGAAVKSGIKLAIGEYLLIQDADLEYDPEEYNILLNPILKGKADVVYGSRFIGGNPHRILFFWHSIGNKFLTFLTNIFTNLNLTDMESGYKVFNTSLLKNIELKEERFGFEPEVTIKISRIPNVRIYEVGISYYGRTYSEGKKINWKDGIRAIFCIFKFGILKL